ncbi:GntR family transcriptional regulator [Thalassobacillus sp. B23F22_16]|uniref:GntR family transcriptional regulator n=1 Tax=Thalassobacillus sp. B23F22_16 TaxID=3459513 RepID=UPI00373F865C
MDIKRDRSTPLYIQLKNIIADKINAGEWAPEQQIPSERELGKDYEVSRITVRQAIDLAVNEGLLYRTHGKGTFVATPTIKQELSKVDSFQSTLSQQGLVASTDIVKAEMTVTDLQLGTLLGVDMIDSLYNLQLVGYGDELPIVFYDSFFPIDIGKQVIEAAREEKKAGRPFTTLDLYKNIGAISPTHSKQTFESVLSDDRLAKILRLDEVTPIFKVTSIIYAEDRAIEYRTSYYKGDKYKFFITRSIQ